MAEENPFSNIPNAPSVEVRTLHGDVQSMSKGGGAAMQVEDIAAMIGRKTSVPVRITPPKSGGNILFKISVLVLVILIAALAVSFIVQAGLMPRLPSFSGLFSSNTTSTSATTSSLPNYVPSAATKNFDPYADIEPERFFRIPADATFSVMLSRQAAETAEDLLTFHQKLIRKAETVPASAKFMEVEVMKDGDRPADGLTFFSLSGVSLFGEKFFEENFDPHMAVFVYRDSKGSWPGYIFRLLSNKNQRLLASDVQVIERAPESIKSLFLSSPGEPTSVYTNGSRRGVITREQTYSQPGASIVYGWQDKYFVISTSIPGLEEALRRLQG